MATIDILCTRHKSVDRVRIEDVPNHEPQCCKWEREQEEMIVEILDEKGEENGRTANT